MKVTDLSRYKKPLSESLHTSQSGLPRRAMLSSASARVAFPPPARQVSDARGFKNGPEVAELRHKVASSLRVTVFGNSKPLLHCPR